MPSSRDHKFEKALRDAVTDLVKAGDLENLTVKRVRAAAEEKLALPQDFFKTNGKWKDKSKDIITEEAERQQSSQGPASSPVKAQSASQLRSESPPAKKGPKRKSSHVKEKPRKRRKKATSSESEIEESERRSSTTSPDVRTPEPVSRNARGYEPESKPSKADQDDTSDVSDPPAKLAEDADRTAGTVSRNDGQSGSELSVLEDDPPPAKKKRQKRSSSETAQKAKGKATKPAKAKVEAAANPQQEEIKRLQGWLIKCGIRKLWHKELAPYETSKAKIKHLKEMLKDVGMDGRYSVEKAKQIREERELKADLEAVQEGAKRWGQSDGEEGGATEEKRPKRRLAKGFHDLAFLDDDDGEDSG